MARIPTYDSQVTQVVAQKEFHVDSTASAVVSGLTQGIKDAANIVDAVSDYQRVQEKEDYELNSMTRDNAITDSRLSLQGDNEEIRTNLAKNPNYKIANEQLKTKFDSIIANPPANLDALSLKEWQHSVNKLYDDLRLNNQRWSISETKRLAKASKERMITDLHNMGLDRYGSSGAKHLPINENGLSLQADGKPAEDYILPKNKSEKAWQNENATEFFDRYLRETPLENPELNNGIFFDMRTIEENDPETFLGFTTKEGRTQRDNGTAQINKFFDDAKTTIQGHPALDDNAKRYLESVADVMKKQRTEEFNALMDRKAQIKQRDMGRETSSFFNTIEYLNLMAGKPTQMSVIEEKPLFGRQAEQTTLLSVADEDFADKYSTAPIGDTNFDAALLHAITSQEFPTGEYTREQLYSKFAPNGTIMEVQALEQMLRNSDVKIIGEEIDAMKPENGFDENAWAYNAVSEIASMPDSTDEEKTRKTAAANHILYQAQKEINGGNGFIDKNLNYFVGAALGGIATEDGYTSAIIDDASLSDMFFNQSFGSGFGVDTLSNPKKMTEWAIRNKGRAKATAEALNGDTNAAYQTLRETDKNVLQQRFKGVLNIDELQTKLENGKPAFFTYNTVPYKYLGFDSDNVFVEIAGMNQKLKKF